MDVQKREAARCVSGNADRRRFHKNSKRELPDEPATPLLGIYPKETKPVSQRDSYIPVFALAFVH